MLQIIVSCFISFPIFINTFSSAQSTRSNNLEPRVFGEYGEGSASDRPLPVGFTFAKPALPKPIPDVNWEWTVKGVKPHYETMSGITEDAGLKSIFVYDANKDTIGFMFQPGEQGPFLAEGAFHDNSKGPQKAETLTYRIRGYDGTVRGQRMLIIAKEDQNKMKISLKQSQMELQRAITEIINPRQHSDPDWFWNEGVVSAKSEMATWTPEKATWIWQQIRYSLGRYLYSEQLFSKVKRSLEHRSKKKRSTSMAMVQAQESGTDPSAEFSQALEAFTGLQANISSLLFPVLNELIAGSNNSIVYQMALSIYSDITLSTAQLIGPFKFGMTAFTSLETQVAQLNNITIFPNGTFDLGENDIGMRGLLAMHSVYEELYLSTWDEAINATNSTGLLADLAVANSYLLPKNRSICPPGWTNSSVSFLDNPDLRGLVMKANLTSPAGSPEGKRI